MARLHEDRITRTNNVKCQTWALQAAPQQHTLSWCSQTGQGKTEFTGGVKSSHALGYNNCGQEGASIMSEGDSYDIFNISSCFEPHLKGWLQMSSSWVCPSFTKPLEDNAWCWQISRTQTEHRKYGRCQASTSSSHSWERRGGRDRRRERRRWKGGTVEK